MKSHTETEQAPAFLRAANLIFPEAVRSKTRVVDLGSIDGVYSFEFAKAGYPVLGIEARKVNIDQANQRRAALGLENVKFVQDDVRNVEKYGPFDIALCAGLLYHLDRPVEFLNLLGKIISRLLILQTHYADLKDRNPLKEKVLRKVFGPDRRPGYLYQNLPLSGLCENEGKRGRWFTEYEEKADLNEVEESAWASYGNHKSFWLTKKDLLQTLRESGFAMLLEQYDFLAGNISENIYIEEHSRSLFLGLKT